MGLAAFNRMRKVQKEAKKIQDEVVENEQTQSVKPEVGVVENEQSTLAEASTIEEVVENEQIRPMRRSARNRN